MKILDSNGILEYSARKAKYRIWYNYPLHSGINSIMFNKYIYKFKGKIYEEYSTEFKNMIEKELTYLLLKII